MSPRQENNTCSRIRRLSVIFSVLLATSCVSSQPYNRMVRTTERPADMILLKEAGRANSMAEDLKGYFLAQGFESVPLSECSFKDRRGRRPYKYDELNDVVCVACIGARGKYAQAPGCNSAATPIATICMGRLAGEKGGRLLFDWTDTRYHAADKGPTCKPDIEALEKFLEPKRQRWESFKGFLEKSYGASRVTWAQTAEEAPRN